MRVKLALSVFFLAYTSADAQQQTSPVLAAPVSRDDARAVTAASVWPTGEQWRRASTRAVRDPRTWVPAVGAVVVAVGGWDAKISRWATSNTPVFGSSESALQASDDLRLASHLLMIGSGLLPGGGEGVWGGRLERMGWEHAGAISASLVTLAVKVAAGRSRPDGSDRLSFPSGHTSRAFAYSAATMQNFSDVPMGGGLRLAGGATAELLAAGTGWARVEAGVHYPTDILIGASLGNAVSVIFCELFRLKSEEVRVNVRSGAAGGSVTVRLGRL
jgi:hypothetical protein